MKLINDDVRINLIIFFKIPNKIIEGKHQKQRSHYIISIVQIVIDKIENLRIITLNRRRKVQNDLRSKTRIQNS